MATTLGQVTRIDPKGARQRPPHPFLPLSCMGPCLKAPVLSGKLKDFFLVARPPARAATFLTLKSAILVRICQLGRHPHTWLQSPFSLHWQTLHPSFGWGWGSGRSVSVLRAAGRRGQNAGRKGVHPSLPQGQNLPAPPSGGPFCRGSQALRGRATAGGRGAWLGWWRGRPASASWLGPLGASASGQGGAGCRAGSGPCTEQPPGSVHLPC